MSLRIFRHYMKWDLKFKIEIAKVRSFKIPATLLFLQTPYSRKPYFYRMFMISLIGNNKMKLKPIPLCRYLCIVPKHTDNIGKLQNVTVFKY